MSDLRDHLLKLLNYDMWANKAWSDFILESVNQHRGAQFSTEASKWLRHMEGCYRNWLDLIDGQDREATSSVDADLATRYDELRFAIVNLELSETRTRASNDATRTVLDIVHHMLNHSTYHRGHLRSLAEQYELDNWPETDYCRFCLVS